MFYIDNVVQKDWIVKGVYDEVPEVYFFLQKEKPQSAADIYSSTPVCFMRGAVDLFGHKYESSYKVQILETSKRKRPKDLSLVGTVDEYKVNRVESDKAEPFFWLIHERLLVEGYKDQLSYEDQFNKD